jgi:magnesium-transporting ATPase (P-type)
MKGADSVVYPLLSQSSKNKYWNYTAAELSRFSTIGLRTLVVAYKELNEDDFLAWFSELKRARSDKVNRAGMVANAENMVERVSSKSPHILIVLQA